MGQRILVVDDEPTNRTVLRLMLERLGHQVDEAKDIETFVEKLSRCEYDAVFTDLFLEDGEVVDAMPRLRAADADGHPTRGHCLDFVAVTGDDTEASRRRCLDAGFVDHVTKPIDSVHLSIALSRAVAQRSVCSGASTPQVPSKGRLRQPLTVRPASNGSSRADWVNVEITGDPGLTEQQLTQVDLHSLLNVLNILMGELYVLRLHVASPLAWVESLTKAQTVTDAVRSGSFQSAHLDTLKELARAFELETARLTEADPGLTADVECSEAMANLRSVINVLRARLGELVERTAIGDRWVAHPIRDLDNSFRTVFAAIEKNSKGRYRIVSNIAAQDERDYLVDLKISSIEGDVITMPPVVQDVLRDLLANARKYTDPGGAITGGLMRDDQCLSLVVEDEGRGIPPGEIKDVVVFGFRASNVSDVRTHGGGFGLTKAYWVARRFGGRMWIRSRLGQGTRVTIRIPVPSPSTS